MSCVKFGQRASRPYWAGRRRWMSAANGLSRLLFCMFTLVCNSSVLSDPCNSLKIPLAVFVLYGFDESSILQWRFPSPLLSPFPSPALRYHDKVTPTWQSGLGVLMNKPSGHIYIYDNLPRIKLNHDFSHRHQKIWDFSVTEVHK